MNPPRGQAPCAQQLSVGRKDRVGALREGERGVVARGGRCGQRDEAKDASRVLEVRVGDRLAQRLHDECRGDLTAVARDHERRDGRRAGDVENARLADERGLLAGEMVMGHAVDCGDVHVATRDGRDARRVATGYRDVREEAGTGPDVRDRRRARAPMQRSRRR